MRRLVRVMLMTFEDMKEIQMVIIRNTLLNQFTTYNYPLLPRVNDFHYE